MAAFDRRKEKNEEVEDFENLYNFSKVTRGFKPKEVNDFITELKRGNNNIIKNYEDKIADYKNEKEMLQCEITELKSTLESREQTQKTAIISAEAARAKLKQIEKDNEEVNKLRAEIVYLKNENSKLLDEKASLEKNVTFLEGDRKEIKDKLEATKKEFAEYKQQDAPNLDEIKNKYEEEIKKLNAELESAKANKAETKVVSNDDDLASIIGAYTIHLKKTRQIVDQLNEQLDKADKIF